MPGIEWQNKIGEKSLWPFIVVKKFKGTDIFDYPQKRQGIRYKDGPYPYLLELFVRVYVCTHNT